MHEHTEYVEGCFACKVKTLQWGRVPGGARQGNYFFEDELRDQFGDLEENAKRVKEITEGYGHLRWENGHAYHKADDGSYEELSPEDMNKVMYGNKYGDPDESRVSISVGRKPGGSSEAAGEIKKHDQEVAG